MFYWGVMSSCPAGSMTELQRVYDNHHSQLEKNGHELGEVGVLWLVLIVSYVTTGLLILVLLCRWNVSTGMCARLRKRSKVNLVVATKNMDAWKWRTRYTLRP